MGLFREIHAIGERNPRTVPELGKAWHDNVNLQRIPSVPQPPQRDPHQHLGHRAIHPRNVTIEYKRGGRSFSPSEPPALLQVCRESRFEALQIYKTFFRTDSSLKNTYVAISQDTIITSETFDGMWKVELQGIQKLQTIINRTNRFFPFGITALKKMQPDL